MIIHSSSKNCNEVLVIDRNQDGSENPEIITLFSKTKKQKAFANHARVIKIFKGKLKFIKGTFLSCCDRRRCL